MSLVLFGVGSPLVVDYEESCARQGLAIVGVVKNVAGPVHTGDRFSIYDADELPERLLSEPFIVPIFTPGRRKQAVDDAVRRRFSRSYTLIDPTAIVARSTTIGPGSFVNSGVVIGAAGRIGCFVLINRSASVGHHAEISDYVAIGPAAVLAGNIKVGRGAMIGAGAIVLPKISIGSNAVISAGSVVTVDVPGKSLVGGQPARVLRSDITGYNGLAA